MFANLPIYSRSRLWLVAVLVGMLVPLATGQQVPPAKDSPRFVDGELLVKFKGGANGAAAARAQQVSKHQVKRRFENVGWQLIRLPPGAVHAQGLEQLRQNPDVLAVEPNYVFSLRMTDTNSGVVPNDPRFSEQWGLARIGATNAWTLTTGSSNVIVAVLDTGVRYTHEDLAANMWRNLGEIPGNGIDDDANGYIDDVHGIDAVNDDSDPIDQPIGFTYHGTACASIIGAVGNNGLGIAGVNWSTRIMALRLAAASNYIASAWVVECFDYVLAMKGRGVNIRVTSNSYGVDDAPSLAVRDAIAAVGNAGILSVFAAGNSNKNVDVVCDYPACFRLPSMINVAASDLADNLAGFSNYGATNVDLAAPGVNIIVADGVSTNAYYPSFSGTSAACPQVAGAAALLAAAYPFATVAQIKSALLGSVDLLPAFTNKVQSHGRLNLVRAIVQPILSSNAPPFVLASPQNQTVGLDYPATFRVIATGAQPINYFWRFNGMEFVQTSEPTLTLPSVSLADAGDYSVRLANAFGMSTSAVGRLTVVTVPTILAQPQSIRVLDRTNINLVVTAAGAFPLAYQWRRDGLNIDLATNAVFALTNADGTRTANYTAVLSNSYGVVTSDVARVTVLTRPYIVAQPESQTVAVGANVTLSISVTNTATLPIGYRWLRNGLSAGSVVLNQFTAATNFPSIQTNHAARWSVLVTNEAPVGITGILSSNAYLTVVIPPTNATALPGSNATFTALAVGPAPIRYQWQRHGVNIDTATGMTLVLNGVQATDAGLYSVVVTNAIGQPTTFSASLQVPVPVPEFAQPRRLSNGSFEALLRQLANQQRYAVEVSTNLTTWSVVETFTANGSSRPFVDGAATGATQRFYRARTDP